MRFGGARYVATRNVLSAQRFRFVAAAESYRSRPRFFCRFSKVKIHWPGRFAANERNRPATKARFVSDERKRAAAAAALRSFRKWGAHWRSDQWHTLSELELGRRDGICLGLARADRQADRNRNSRKEISRDHRKETTL